MTESFSLRNARLVLADEVVKGSIRIKDGVISSIDPGGCGTASATDVDGDYLFPGLIEIHTDNFEHHLMPRPKVSWAEMPALLAHDAEVAAAGITTVFDALGVGTSDIDSPRGTPWSKVVKVLDHCVDRKLLRAEHLLHVRCELPAPNAIELFEPFERHQRLMLLSLMDHTPGQRQWENIEQARIYYTGKKGWSDSKFDLQVARSAELQSRFSEPNRRFFAKYAQVHGIPLASHDDTTVAHVEQACNDGAVISEFPTTLTAARAARARSMFNVMGAPNVVRGGSHSGNVSAASLAREGLLDVLSSDYVPSSLLAAVTRLHDDGLCNLPQAVAIVSANPARATGLNDRGSLFPGLRADLLRVSMVERPHGGLHAVVRSVWRQGVRVI